MTAFNMEEAKTIADILMGAAYADETLRGSETAAIKVLLGVLLDTPELPADLEAHLSAFQHAGFDLAATAKRLHLNGREDRRALLAVVNKVGEADNMLDIDEEGYLIQLSQHIGSEPEEINDLAVEDLRISSLWPSAEQTSEG